MDTKQPSRRTVMKVLGIAIAVPLAVVSFLVPGMLHAELVSAWGVLAANEFTTLTTVVAGALGLGATGLSVSSIRQAIKHKHAVDLAKEEEEEWNTPLPPQEETNPDVFEPALHRIAKRYTEAAPPIEVTLTQLALVRQSLEKVSDILNANAGLLSRDHKRFGSVEILIQAFLAEFCPGLVRIVYQAHETTLVSDLVRVIKEVNNDNKERVSATIELANGVVDASARRDTDSIMSQVREAIKTLQDPTDTEKDWL